MNSHLENDSHRLDNRVRRISWIGTLCVALALTVTTSRAATMTVTNTADSGAGSLRAAIAAASNGDAIVFSLPAPSTITLTSGGLLVSNLTLTIAGPGPNTLAISGNATNTVFSFISNSVANLSGMTITNGSGGIYAGGYYYPNPGGGVELIATTVIVSNVVVSGNSSQSYGGVYAQLCNLQIIDSTISNNSSSHGGAIYLSSGTTTINNVLVSSNSGCGIFCLDADLQMNNTSIIGNSSPSGNGGGMALEAPMGTCSLSAANVTISGNSATNGGGIYLTAGLGNVDTYLSNITITGNRAASAGGGIYFDHVGLNLNNSVISSNWAGLGGGIYSDHGEITLANVPMMGNAAIYAGGAASIDNATLQISNAALVGNSAGGSGGAISSSSGGYGTSTSVTLSSCVVSNNSASQGGAIWSVGDNYGASVRVFGSTLSYNRATNAGGAIYNGTGGGGGYVAVVGSTFNGNVAASGGGVYSSASPNDGYFGAGWLGITNSTFSSNSAAVGGAIFNKCSAPPPTYNGTASATIQIFNSTFTGNSAANSGGFLFNTNFGTGTAPVLIGSSIINAGLLGGTILDGGGAVTSAGFNLCSDNAGGALTTGTDLINTDPQLGPLQNNGGTVLTCALLPSSPAIDKGKNFSASAYDERGPGYTRIYDYPSVPNAVGGDGTDIGAFELQTAFDPFALWQFQNFGCTNCPQAAPSADPDGDGTDNLAEYLAGTNPNNASSVFRVLGVARQGNDLLVTWQTSGGHTNVLQSSGSLANGSFSDVSSNIVIPGTGDATSSYLESGAALGGTNSFYRVRLGQ